jgi:phospholipase D1/2
MTAWHDTSMTIAGPSVVDLVQHFCERWNFVKKIKWAELLILVGYQADLEGTSMTIGWIGWHYLFV